MAQPLLSDLCSICYTEVPKYRCPRCKTQTCSLPCYKRHQQRASCNGKRDPAAYLKKSQLATPAGIDLDYNYLKGVERNIEDASQDARERGIPTVRGATDTQTRGPKREGAFQRYLTVNNIAVEYAPKGLSRQKSNQSRVTKSGSIFWTVEWIDGTGEREVRDNAPESSTLRELFNGIQTAKRGRNKRKMSSAATDAARGKAKKTKVPASVTPATTQNEDPQEAGSPPQDSDAEQSPEPIIIVDAEEKSIDQDSSAQQEHFYLLRPSTRTPSRVLIPVDPTLPLTTALGGHSVQEYPTFYVLHEPPDSLPEGFVLESEYLKSAGKYVRPAASPMSGAARGANAEPVGNKSGGGELDAKAILDMLKRDVRA